MVKNEKTAEIQKRYYEKITDESLDLRRWLQSCLINSDKYSAIMIMLRKRLKSMN